MDKIVVLFISRNKDNKDKIPFFKERRVSRFMDNDASLIEREFDKFVSRAADGELCRCYISVACRNEDRVRKDLMHKLLEEDVDLSKIEPLIASLAMQAHCAAEKQWLFDFDIDDKDQVEEFIEDIHKINPMLTIRYKHTIHGYSVITYPFDVRSLFEKWEPRGVKRDDLKKDGMVLVNWKVKGE